MKIRELKLHSGSAVASAWPPSWGGHGSGPWPIGAQGMIVDIRPSADGRSLVVVNDFKGGRHEGTLVVEHPESTLPRVFAVLKDRLPISMRDAGELELPREMKYRGHTIEASSYQGQPPGGQWGWVPRAVVTRDEGSAVQYQALGDGRNRIFETQEEADAVALGIARAWIDERG
jgi:hypothetical protein